jgi:uncharacterized protein YbaR (Trm112 family)
MSNNDDWQEYVCPSCQARFVTPVEDGGDILCPRCRQWLTIREGRAGFREWDLDYETEHFGTYSGGPGKIAREWAGEVAVTSAGKVGSRRICPDCKGRGVCCVEERGDYSVNTWCDKCKGTGKVPDEEKQEEHS